MQVFFDWAGIDFSVESFKFYTVGHFVMIFTMVFILSVLFLFCLGKRKWINVVLWTTSAIALILQASLLIYSFYSGIYYLEWYVPLHICNLFVVALPVVSIFKGKIREFFKDFLVFGGLFGCCIAIIFPITTLYYFPVSHFVSVVVWMYHVLIGFVGGYLVVSGNYRRFSAVNLLSILTVLVAGSYVANHYLDTNFLFINPNKAVFPLTMFYDIFGNWGTYGVITIVYVVAISLQVSIYLASKAKAFSILKIYILIKENQQVNSIVGLPIFRRLVKSLDNKTRGKLTSILEAIKDSGVVADFADLTIADLKTAKVRKIIFKSTVVDDVAKILRFKQVRKLEKEAKTELSLVEASA